LFGSFAEKDRKGLLGKIKDFVYNKAGWQIPTPAPEGKNALLLLFHTGINALS